jgi:hypothetical protein
MTRLGLKRRTADARGVVAVAILAGLDDQIAAEAGLDGLQIGTSPGRAREHDRQS